jgi:hypothetical protein
MSFAFMCAAIFRSGKARAQTMSELPISPQQTRFPFRRWLPLATIMLISAGAIAMGWHRHLS